MARFEIPLLNFGAGIFECWANVVFAGPDDSVPLPANEHFWPLVRLRQAKPCAMPLPATLPKLLNLMPNKPVPQLFGSGLAWGKA